MTFLLDSGIVADLISPSPDPIILQWLDQQEEETLFISVATLAQLSEFIAQEPNGKEKEKHRSWLTNDLLIRFSGRFCAVTETVAIKWGEVLAELRSLGRALTLTNSIELAIALVYGHTIVTKDIAIYEDVGVKVLNPSIKKPKGII
jgi:predicted nucleic acid-binding protein